jgi:DNA-binding SARP family transcriptional activator
MEFRILGPLEAWEAGREVSLGRPNRRALLAALPLRPNEVGHAPIADPPPF